MNSATPNLGDRGIRLRAGLLSFENEPPPAHPFRAIHLSNNWSSKTSHGLAAGRCVYGFSPGDASLIREKSTGFSKACGSVKMVRRKSFFKGRFPACFGTPLP